MTSVLPWRRRARPTERPLRSDVLRSDHLEEYAAALAARFSINPDARRPAQDAFRRFDENVRVLRQAYSTLADDVRAGEFIASAAEWLLDNFHLVAAEIADIRRNLPRTYARSLPRLAARETAGCARVYAMS